jgi:uncharacterized protein YdeI (BOF family)
METIGKGGLFAMRRFIILWLIVAAIAMIFVAGCSSDSATKSSEKATTASSTSNAKRVAVEEIALNPTAYDGAIVTTEGNYAVGYCSACFLLKDGVHAVRVEVSDTAPLPPESRLNSRMEVTGKIYVAQGSPNIVAEEIIYK